MINFRGAKFIKSATKREEIPEKGLPEVVFIGKSNVGKSSLINAIVDNKNLCFTSSKPGHTRLLNYFEILNECYLVDAPGYGYSKAGGKHSLLFGEMMEEYLTDNIHLKLIIFLLDSRHDLSIDDIDFLKFLSQERLPFVISMTKCDKLNQKEKSQLKKRIADLHLDNELKIHFTSSTSKTGLEELKSDIVKHIKLA